MLIRKRLMPAVRRFAAGIDVNEREARLVVLSRRGRRAAPFRVEWLDAVPLGSGAIAKGRVADRAALGGALSTLVARWPGRCIARSLACAMAIPGSLTSITSMTLPRAAVGARDDALPQLERAVLAHAERVAGLERQALAVDWCVDEWQSGRVSDDMNGAPAAREVCVSVAATAREHLEARIEAAAGAGLALAALDGEPPAALRALRHAAVHRLRTRDRYAVLWAGSDGLYAWRVGATGVEAQVRYPALEHEDFAAALRTLGGEHALECAVIGGELDALRTKGVTPADVGDLLGCAVLLFECGAFFDAYADASLGRNHRCARTPTFAVAFGLALRGVAA